MSVRATVVIGRNEDGSAITRTMAFGGPPMGGKCGSAYCRVCNPDGTSPERRVKQTDEESSKRRNDKHGRGFKPRALTPA